MLFLRHGFHAQGKFIFRSGASRACHLVYKSNESLSCIEDPFGHVTYCKENLFESKYIQKTLQDLVIVQRSSQPQPGQLSLIEGQNLLYKGSNSTLIEEEDTQVRLQELGVIIGICNYKIRVQLQEFTTTGIRV